MKHLKSAALAGLIAAWFLGQTWKGLLTKFDDDDLMNMHYAWTLPLYKLVLANLTPFSTVYRPFGSALYRVEYVLGGFNPLPFRIVAYALMMLNIWLIYRLARLLTGSTEVAILCALIGSYHRRLLDVYLNNGTIYDVLCFSFFCFAFSFYVAVRQKYGSVSGRRLLGFCLLYTLALNSKEMAVTLPAVLLAYELIYHTPSRWRPKPLLEWISTRGALWLSVLITAVAIRAKTAAGSSLTGNPEYALHFSLQQFFSTTVPLISHLFFRPERALNATAVISLFVLVWAVAIATRNRSLMLGAVMITVLPLPINFITYRGFFVMYFPLLGWTLYLATVLVATRQWLRRPPAASLFLATALVLFIIQSRDAGWSFDRSNPHQILIHALKDELPKIRPAMPANGRVLFLKDPFDAESWNPLYIVHLTYHDPNLAVIRVKKMAPGSSPAPANLVLNYCAGHYREASHPCQ